MYGSGLFVSCVQRIIRTHAKDSKAWFGRDKNTVAVALEALQNKPVRSPKLFELFFNNLMVWWLSCVSVGLCVTQLAKLACTIQLPVFYDKAGFAVNA